MYPADQTAFKAVLQLVTDSQTRIPSSAGPCTLCALLKLRGERPRVSRITHEVATRDRAVTNSFPVFEETDEMQMHRRSLARSKISPPEKV